MSDFKNELLSAVDAYGRKDEDAEWKQKEKEQKAFYAGLDIMAEFTRKRMIENAKFTGKRTCEIKLSESRFTFEYIQDKLNKHPAVGKPALFITCYDSYENSLLPDGFRVPVYEAVFNGKPTLFKKDLTVDCAFKITDKGREFLETYRKKLKEDGISVCYVIRGGRTPAGSKPIIQKEEMEIESFVYKAPYDYQPYVRSGMIDMGRYKDLYFSGTHHIYLFAIVSA